MEVWPTEWKIGRLRAQTFTPVVYLVLAVVLIMLFAATAARASEAAENFVQESVGRGYEILNNLTLSEEERSAQFRDFMLSLTDISRIALFTLGPYANGASTAETDGFVEAFTNYAVSVYETGLSTYGTQTLTVVGSVDRAADDSVVSADISDATDPSAPIVRVAFRVRSDATGDPIVIDMQVEGVWLAISQRADFTSYLQQNGGSVPDLSATLERRAEQIRLEGGGAN